MPRPSWRSLENLRPPGGVSASSFTRCASGAEEPVSGALRQKACKADEISSPLGVIGPVPYQGTIIVLRISAGVASAHQHLGNGEQGLARYSLPAGGVQRSGFPVEWGNG